MGNIGYKSIFCSQNFLDKYNNGSIWRNPIILPGPPLRTIKNNTNFLENISDFFIEYSSITKTFTVGVDGISLILIIFLLIINQKRNIVEGFGLRIFANNLLGFLFYRVLCRLIIDLYEIIWNFLKYRIGYCIEKWNMDNGTLLETSFVFNPDGYANCLGCHNFITMKVFDFQIDLFLYGNEDIAQFALPCITMLQLFLHRTTIYAGISYPLIYQEFFKEKLLKLYYFIIWFIFLSYRYGLYFQDSNLYNSPSNKLTIIFVIGHLIITALSLKAVWEYHHTKQKEMQEIKAFIGFSIYPVLTSIFEQLFSAERGGILVGYIPSIYLINILIVIIDLMNPLYMTLIFFIFLKPYRKATLRLLCFWKSKQDQNVVQNIQHFSISRSG